MRYQAAYLNSEFDEEAGVPNTVSQISANHAPFRRAETVDEHGSAGSGAIRGNHRSRRDAGAAGCGLREEQSALELVMQPQLASVLFRFRPQAQMDDAGIALLNQKIGDALLESGRANVGVTEHNGITCLKLTLLNPTVTLEDVKVLLSLVERTAQEVMAK